MLHSKMWPMTIADCGRKWTWLRGRTINYVKRAAATQRLTVLLQFKEQATHYGYAQVIGRDSSNRYRSMILNKGESDGIQKDMGVITSGVVGRS